MRAPILPAPVSVAYIFEAHQVPGSLQGSLPFSSGSLCIPPEPRLLSTQAARSLAHARARPHARTYPRETRARLVPRFTSRTRRMPAAAGPSAALGLGRSALVFQERGALGVFNRYHGHVEVTDSPSPANLCSFSD